MVLLILVAVWVAVLLPPYLQNRRESRPSDSISTFRQQLAVLERATPGHLGENVTRMAPYRATAPLRASARVQTVALRKADAVRRRRDVFLTLLAAAGVTFLAALVLGGPVWMLHLLVDAFLFGYTAMLIQIQQRGTERERKVAYLPRAGSGSSEPALLLRRSGS
jgi:hypothetical protein